MSPSSDSEAQSSASLPPINPYDSSKRAEAEIQAAQTMVNINPHSSHKASSLAYATAPYSYASSATSSAPASATTQKTSTESHSDHDGHPHSAPLKQSLPSIHEALAQGPADEHIRPAPRSPGPKAYYAHRNSSPSPTRFNRSYALDTKNYDSYAMQRQSSQYEQVSRPPLPSPRHYGPVTSGARPPSPQEHYPVPSSRAAPQYAPAPLATHSPPRAAPQYGPPATSPSFGPPSYSYSQRQPSTTYGASSSQEYVTSFPAVSTSTQGGARELPWHGEDTNRFPGPKVDPREVQFPSAVRRQLDHYDLDSVLNEVYDCSHNLMQFSEVYRLRSHQSQRSGPIAGSTPSISDVYHAMKFNAKIKEALDFALQKLRADEAERLERESREAAERRQYPSDRVNDIPTVRKETGEGGFAGPDSKKRRGRAAPPGRCHACNRSETPEWRRGPDGARTLCNACGLHYAKHTRKIGAQKAASLQQAGSNLRPKSSGQN